MTTQELIHYIQHPEYLQAEHVSAIQRLCNQYPYCAAFAILLAKNLDNIQDMQARQQLRKAALYAFHREHLQAIMQIPAQAEPTKAETSSPTTAKVSTTSEAGVTEATNTTGATETTGAAETTGTADTTEATNLTNSLNSIGYEFTGTNLGSTRAMKGQDLIDKFIAENPRMPSLHQETSYFDQLEGGDSEGLAPNLDAPEPSESVFTESLAKIYIKQKQYEKALHIFEKLNLKFPEKSAYFADQISFLKKIIQTNS